MQKIINITTIIQNDCPELYKNLTETPLFLNYKEEDIKKIDYKRYLNFLKSQLKVFKKHTDV